MLNNIRVSCEQTLILEVAIICHRYAEQVGKGENQVVG